MPRGSFPKGTVKKIVGRVLSLLQLPEGKEMGFGATHFLMGPCEYFDCVGAVWGLELLSAKYSPQASL